MSERPSTRRINLIREIQILNAYDSSKRSVFSEEIMTYLSNLVIGFCIMNAMPHLLFGVMGIRFISPFGYTSANQLTWSAVNIAVALLLYHREYDLSLIHI